MPNATRATRIANLFNQTKWVQDFGGEPNAQTKTFDSPTRSVSWGHLAKRMMIIKSDGDIEQVLDGTTRTFGSNADTTANQQLVDQRLAQLEANPASGD